MEGRERERDLLRFRYGRISVRSVFSRFTPQEKCVPGEPIEVFTSKNQKAKKIYQDGYQENDPAYEKLSKKMDRHRPIPLKSTGF